MQLKMRMSAFITITTYKPVHQTGIVADVTCSSQTVADSMFPAQKA